MADGDGGDGWLYGVTEVGGEYRLGTVFRMKPETDGPYTYEVLHSFGGPDVEVIGSDTRGPDGNTPCAGLLIASDGRLYGVTTTDSQLGSGTVFTLRKDGGDYQVLRRFCATDYYNDGRGPYGKLVEDCDGWLYGTTYSGGGSQTGNGGTVFKIRKNGTGYKTIKRFLASDTEVPDPEGYDLRSGLVLDHDWLYGTTSRGGRGSWGYIYGTVFKLNRHGTNYGDEKLWSFGQTATDGQVPSELILDHSGEWLYGTTSGGGSASGGTVFRIQKDAPHAYQVLWNFWAVTPDAGAPQVGLVEGADGTFYGTTQYGPYVGTVSSGAIFKLRATESEFDYTVLRYFYVDTVGQLYAPLVRGPDCQFYASSVQGGDMAWGTVYRFDPTPGDYPPRAVADTLDTKVNTPLVVPVSALIQNDSYRGDASFGGIALDDSGSAGTASVESGIVTYQPNPGYVGWDSFAYWFTDGSQTSFARVNVLVRPTFVWVDDDYGPLFCEGHKWGVNAFADIQDGIEAVADHGFVAVASGNYSSFDVGTKQLKIVLGHSPGHVTINGSLILSTNTTLEIELAGTTPGTGFDQLVVTNTATLAGTVELKLTDGFYPAPEAAFKFLTARACSGSFDQFLYPSNDVGAVLSATPTSIVAQVVNVRPEIPTIAGRAVDEGALLSLPVNASDADTPAQTLTYALTNSPAGATVSPTGEITWTPTEAQGPMTTNITVLVTDSGTPNLTVSRTFQVVVNEINVAPLLTLPTSQAFDEQTAFNANATAADSDLPPNAWEFALVSGPDGLTVSPSGAIAWTPTEAQGSNVYTVTVRVTDTNPGAVNDQHLSTTNSFELTVREVNRPPVMGTLADQSLNPGEALGFTATATDPDLPANALAFSLLSPPAGATMDAAGLFTWRPGVALADTTNMVSVRVQDDGSPLLSDTNSFFVIVNPLSVPVVLTPGGWSGGQFNFSVTGPIGPDYIVQTSSELSSWAGLCTNTPATMPFSITDTNAATFGWRFYRVRLGP